jgi:hypothetical protein
MEHIPTQDEKLALWMEKYGPSLDRESPVEFEGKSFVLAGLKLLEEEHGLNMAEEITARGGVIRTDVSGRTDYLVVDPRWGHESKLRAAMVQRAKGKEVKLILGSDLLRALTGAEEPIPAAALSPTAEDAPVEQAAPSRREELELLCREQEAIIAASKGWFGENARRRKAAQARLEELRQTISREFPAESA